MMHAAPPSERYRHARCRLYGDFVPLDDVPMHLANGWRVLDQLADDPSGRDFALLAPPRAADSSTS